MLIEEADENGNILSPSSAQLSETLDGLTVSYTYDLFNRLISTKTGKKTVSFDYEADGYRHSKSTVSPSSEENIVYFYEGDHVAFEEDETGNVTAVNHYGTSHYARTINEGEEETTFYYQFNAYGDVIALIGTDGNTIAKYEYDAFGNLTSQPDVRVNNSITYRGYEYDSETGLYYLNARYYDSETARFLTEDTYRGEKNDPLSLNLYTYCKNNPLKYTDPTGHEAFTIIVGGVLFKVFLGAGFSAILIEELLKISKIDNDIETIKRAVGSFDNKEKADDSSTSSSTSSKKQKKKGKKKPTSQNQMQKQVENKQAPKQVDRVDKPHTSNGKPHVHFGDNYRGINNDGTWHDEGKKIPQITNEIIEWLKQNGWGIPNEFSK